MVEECEAFLAGTYVELCEARGEAVPVWAWMNLLAHGTEDQLRGGIVQHASGAGPWRHARGFLAGELLDRVDTAQLSLPEFQATVLVPLELEMACSGAMRWQPRQLVARLLDTFPDKHSPRHR